MQASGHAAALESAERRAAALRMELAALRTECSASAAECQALRAQSAADLAAAAERMHARAATALLCLPAALCVGGLVQAPS